MDKRIITISRQYGSGGHAIARMVAERLDIPFYDNQLITEVAKQSGFSEAFVKENDEHASYSNSFLYQLAMSVTGSHGRTTSQQQVFDVQSRIIRDLAERESCVIVGRCADYILRDRLDCLNVFVYADTKRRCARILEQYGLGEKSTEARMKEQDNRRRNYYRHFTNKEWGLCSNYHLSLDSGMFGLSKCADLIVAAAKDQGV